MGMRDRGSGTRKHGSGSPLPDPGPRIPDPGSRTPDPGSRTPDPGPRSWEDMVLVGRIARPHGLRGQVIVNPETDFVEDRFVNGATLWARSDRGDEALTITSARVQNGR